MQFMETLKSLCEKPGSDNRWHWLRGYLGDRAQYLTQDGNHNIVVPAVSSTGPVRVVAAHYDVVHGSYGYNDNGSGIVAALSLLDSRPADVEIVFTDNEEVGFLGASAYVAEQKREISLGIALDVCGIPGKVYYQSEMGVLGGDAPAQPTAPLVGVSGTGAREIIDGTVPYNDSWAFREFGIPSMIVMTGPELTGRVLQPFLASIWEHQHTGLKDTVDGWKYLSEQSIAAAAQFTLDVLQRGENLAFSNTEVSLSL